MQRILPHPVWQSDHWFIQLDRWRWCNEANLWSNGNSVVYSKCILSHLRTALMFSFNIFIPKLVASQSSSDGFCHQPTVIQSYVTADARSMAAGVLSWHADWRQFTNKIWACLTKVQVCFMWLRDELFIGSLPSCRHLSRPAYSRQAPYIIDVWHRVLQRWLNAGPASWRWPNIESAAGSRLFSSAVRYPLMACW